MAKDVVVVIGAGGIGVAIARRQGIGKTILLADFNEKTLQAAAQDLQRAGYTVSTHHVDVSSRQSVGSLVDAAELISYGSPVPRALIGKAPGDRVVLGDPEIEALAANSAG